MKKLRVIVADDHPVVRLGICNALQKEADIEVVAQAENGVQAVALTRDLHPDVLILDAQMPEMDGLEATRAVRAQYPDVRILILSAYAHDHYVFGALGEGAGGYLLKDEAIAHVVSAVRTVAENETWLSPKVATKVVQRSTARAVDDELGPDHPTEREMEVLALLAQGLSNVEIAQSLYITERTVRFHVSNLKAKLHTSSRIELVVEAIRLGLVDVT